MKTFAYQNRKGKNYFEGWYLRLTDDSNDINIAIIWAVTKDINHPHSFIQYYDGTAKQAKYYEFPMDSFHFNQATLQLSIGTNQLSLETARLSTTDVTIEATFSDPVYLQPYHGHQSAMGFLSKAPLECFQEIIYLDAKATFTINGTDYQGKAYMEKTYGTNFPSKWIWLQSNYGVNKSLLTFSVGKVPILFFKVKGFLLVYEYNGLQQRFGSFNFAKIKVLESNHHSTTFEVRRRQIRIVITANSIDPVKLIGPRKNGTMNLDVFESITSTATMKVYQNHKLLFEDTYHNVGLEIMY